MVSQKLMSGKIVKFSLITTITTHLSLSKKFTLKLALLTKGKRLIKTMSLPTVVESN